MRYIGARGYIVLSLDRQWEISCPTLYKDNQSPNLLSTAHAIQHLNRQAGDSLQKTQVAPDAVCSHSEEDVFARNLDGSTKCSVSEASERDRRRSSHHLILSPAHASQPHHVRLPALHTPSVPHSRPANSSHRPPKGGSRRKAVVPSTSNEGSATPQAPVRTPPRPAPARSPPAPIRRRSRRSSPTSAAHARSRTRATRRT